MSTLTAFQFLRTFPRLHSVSRNIVRYRRWTRHRNFAQNTLDPDKDFFLHDELEDEPVAYIDDSLDAAVKPKKLTKSMERELQKELLRKQIVKKKEIKELMPKEPSLLTWAARAQIKHLHKRDPEQWDPETLARSFPVSTFVIKEIIRSKLLPYDMHEIHKHDRVVYKNWLKLKEQAEAYQGGRPVDPVYRTLLEDENRRSKLINAAGMADLPVPQEQTMIQTQQDIAEQARPQVKRQFSAILDSYRTDHHSQETSINSLHKGYIGFNDPEMLDILEDISKLTISKESEVLRIEGENLANFDSEQQCYLGDIENEEESAEANFQRSHPNSYKTKVDDNLKWKSRSRTMNPNTDPRSWTDNRQEYPNNRLSGAESQDHGREKRTYSKQHTREVSDNSREQKSRTMKGQSPLYFKNEQRRNKYKDHPTHKEVEKGEHPHFGIHDERHKKYRQYSDDIEDEFDGSLQLDGSLEDIYLLNKPKQSKAKKKLIKKVT